MSELVERVARAICASDGFAPVELWEGTPLWDRYEDNARAAIAAIPDAAEQAGPERTSDMTLIHGQTYLNKRGDLIGPMDERAPGKFLDQYGRGYAASGQMWDHTQKSTANIALSTAGSTKGWLP